MRKTDNIAKLDEIQTGCEVLISGKIQKIRKLGGLEFVTLCDQSGKCQLVVENMDFPFRRFDFISVKGTVQECNSRKEIHVLECSLLGSSNPRTEPYVIGSDKMDKLIFKSEVMQVINSFMNSEGFLPVSSPTIVGNWVEGKTHTFSVDYYGTKKYLTLNSMLYHQVMLISGFNKIYEFSKIFRQDATSSKDRLSEFVSLDISMSNSDKFEMMSLIENMIKIIVTSLNEKNALQISANMNFEKISYHKLMELSECKKTSGAQLSAKSRRYLDENYDSFVWVYGFPEEKRRFFVKSQNGICEDYQLWYRGDHQIAAGGERETDLVVIKQKLVNEGKKEANYNEILKAFEGGVPPMCEIGFGLDRFLLDITDSSVITDFVAFPRNGNTKF